MSCFIRNNYITCFDNASVFFAYAKHRLIFIHAKVALQHVLVVSWKGQDDSLDKCISNLY